MQGLGGFYGGYSVSQGLRSRRLSHQSEQDVNMTDGLKYRVWFATDSVPMTFCEVGVHVVPRDSLRVGLEKCKHEKDEPKILVAVPQASAICPQAATLSRGVKSAKLKSVCQAASR